MSQYFPSRGLFPSSNFHFFFFFQNFEFLQQFGISMAVVRSQFFFFSFPMIFWQLVSLYSKIFNFFFLSLIHIYFLVGFHLVSSWLLVRAFNNSIVKDVGFTYCLFYFYFIFLFSQQIGFSIDRKGQKIQKITIGPATCYSIPAVQWQSCYRL